MWRLVVTSTLVLGGVLNCQAAAAAALEPSSSQLVPAHLPGSAVASQDVLIVSLLDGHVVALDQHTGRVLWTFDSGAPLVSARQSYASSQGLNVFPGTDGGLYAYHGISHLNPGLERLPISLPELVESAPSLTADGSLILGRRDSKVFLLDRRTGRSVHTLSNADAQLEDHSASLGLTLGVPRDQLLFLGRQDYMVRSVRMDTKAETWNATFSKLFLLQGPGGGPAGAAAGSSSVKEFFQGSSSSSSSREAAAAAAAAAAGGGSSAAALPHLVVGSDNSLQAYDPNTMLRKWFVEFETPPVSAYRQDGRGGNALDPAEQAAAAAAAGGGGSSSWASLTGGFGGGGGGLLPALLSGGGSNQPVPAAAAGGGGFMAAARRKVKGQLAGGTSVLVGALHGSLYALPADHLMLTTAGPAEDGSSGSGGGSATTGTGAVVWPKRAGRMPLDITPAVVDVCAAAATAAGADAAPPPKQRLPPGSAAAAAAAAADGNGSGGGGSGSSALVALLDDSAEPGGAGVVALSPVDSTGAGPHHLVRDELNTLTCPPLGIHPITVQQQGRTVGWLPLAGLGEAEVRESTAGAHRPGSLTAWLAGLSRRALFTLLAALLLLPMLLFGGARGYVGSGSSSSSRALAAAGQHMQHHAQVPVPLALPGPGGVGAAVGAGAASPAGKKKGSKHKNKSKQQQQGAAVAAAAANGVDGKPGSSGGDGATGDSSSSSKKGSKDGSSSSSNGTQQQGVADTAAANAGGEAGDRAAAADAAADGRQSPAPAASTPTNGSLQQQRAGGGAALSPLKKQQPQGRGGGQHHSTTTVSISSPIRSSSPAGVDPLEHQMLLAERAASGGSSSAPATPASQQPEGSAAAAASALSPSGAGGGAGAADSAAAAVGTPVGGSGGHGMMAQQQQHHRSYVDADGAVVIGRLRVGPKELGFGSAGTIVYEGVLDSRPVAVKRLLRQFYTLARKEINVLVVSDEHPNVVRCFAMEEDREFVYLALERCKTSLAQFMTDQGGAALLTEASSGAPTPWCMAVLSDTAAGLAALHERQIVHRDLKPHNVLLTESGRAKLSDMGLSKQLVSEQSSFESHGSGGSSGWQAPEQLIAKDGGSARQSRAIDVFSLGCVMFYCLSGGKHPFGEHYERDTNIIRGLCNLSALQRWPEAVNLLSAMLSKNPLNRPGMAGVLAHPFWWSDEQRLQFLVDVSDRVENEDREPDPTLLRALEAFSASAVGSNWGAALDAELVANLGRYRRYDYTCLRDLLRVVRNKRNHFREMPEGLQQLMGPLSTGYYKYFSSRFPMLLLAVFFFALHNLCDDPNLAKYFAAPAATAAGSAAGCLSALDAGDEPGSIFSAFRRPWDSMSAKAARASRLALASSSSSSAAAGAGGGGGGGAANSSSSTDAGLAAAAAAAGASAGKGSRRNSGSMAAAVGPSPTSKLGPGAAAAAAAAAAALAGHQMPPAGTAAAGKGSAGGAAAAAGMVPPGSPPNQVPVWPPGLLRSTPGGGSGTTPPRPPRTGAFSSSNGGMAAAGHAAGGVNSSSSLSNGGGALQHAQASSAAADAADAAETGGASPFPASAAKAGGVVVGYELAEGQEELHVLPFPSRPGKQHCDFFVKTGHCKFGEECVFDHPPEFSVPLTEQELPYRPGQPVCGYYSKTRQCKFGAACKFHHPKLVPILAGSAVVVQQQ